MFRRLGLFAGSLLLVVTIVGLRLTTDSTVSTRAFESPLAYGLAVEPFVSPLAAQTTGPNLLINGDMNGAGGLYPFYWRPTNHFVAGMWYEWFWTTNIPEFIDGGHPHHNECYPPPAPGRGCHDEGNHSQGYIRWGDGYIGGIYQPVSVTPCINYRFEIYNSNQPDPGYITKVGIDPTGQNLPPHDEHDRHQYPKNCPPDYRSECPNPGVDTLDELPPNIIWSPESRQLYWHLQTITAEAVSSTLAVWTYADSTRVQIPPKSTYWDYASLVAVPFPNNRLPAPTSSIPSGFITNVVTRTVLDLLIIEWDTLGPASTQVWYKIVTATVPITPTGPFTIYLPLVMRQGPPDYPLATALDTTPTTRHRAVIYGLQGGTRIEFIALSRRPLTNVCVTEVSEPLNVIIDSIPPITRIYLPLVMRGR